MMVSECCQAAPWGDEIEYGICGDCREHCSFVDEDAEDEPAKDREFSPNQEAIIAELIRQSHTCAECDSDPCVCCPAGDPRDPAWTGLHMWKLIGEADGTKFYRCSKCNTTSER